ncbi:MAG: hypothetical protein CL944_00745 [Candidatus Diapherotrites archaeon]|uniref:Uncharacterized protein n=1 Tax=Candidatus Iainarchaeum sp. TaxID=3101447 RepID=A0A2D6LP66_9ARCH|nr:hypothetical protein [Candidatus Diapherotrites archaeon]
MAKKGLAWESSFLIKDKAKEKFLLFKDIHWTALVIVEFFLTLILVGGILLYLDGRFNTIDFPINLVIFAAIGYGVLYFYRYTEQFRTLRGMKKETSFKSFILEFIIFIVIVGSAYLYEDPNINILPYPFNIFLFVILVGIPLYFYVNEKFVRLN